jgi:N utilization substance protein B
MASRRRIREAAVQFLYGADLERDALPDAAGREAAWDFIMESECRALQVAAFRTLSHLAQGRAERVEEFLARMAPAIARLAAHPEAEALRGDLGRLAELEQAWTAAFERLESQPAADNDKSAVASRFRHGLATLHNLNRELAATRRRFIESLDDFPALRGPLEPVASSLRRLQRIGDRMRMAECPEDYPGEDDIRKLRETSADLANLRQRAGDLVNAVLAHRSEIDQTLAAVVENFSPERIDPVDRAVLRLATYELGHTATPVKVVINEAVDLARRYGSTDSHRFVNGLLDPVARRLRE